MTERMLSAREVSAKTGLTVKTLENMRAVPKDKYVGPPYIRYIGVNRVVYPEDACDAWLASQTLVEPVRRAS